MRVMVTGATGFIGYHLCAALLQKSVEIIPVSRSSINQRFSYSFHRSVNILNRCQIVQVLEETYPDVIVHLAASKNRSLNLDAYRSEFEVNLNGTMNLVEACQKYGRIKKFVYLGSCDEYGVQSAPFRETDCELPLTAYGASKLAATKFLQAQAKLWGFPTVILRPSVVYGPGQDTSMFLPSLIQSIFHNELFELSEGKQTRDFIFIDDLIESILLLINEKNFYGEIINISSGISITIKELANLVVQIMGRNSGQLLKFSASNYRKSEIMNYVVNNEKAFKLIGWYPKTSIEEGISKIIRYHHEKENSLSF